MCEEYNKWQQEQQKELLLTVIIPVYRVSDTIDRCVESVLHQDYSHLQIILVDDGSPDDCPEKCDFWAARDNRITVIHKANGGLSDARNAGIDNACGDYVTFVDSDDYLRTHTYRDVMDILIKHPDYDMLEFPAICHYGSARQEPLSMPDREYAHTDDYWMESQAYCHAYAWNKIYRRRLFYGVQFPVGRVFEDIYTLPRLLRGAEVVATTSNGLYYYCHNDNGITACAKGSDLTMLLDAHLNVMFWYKDYPTFHHYYMHVANIQISEYELTGNKPRLKNVWIKSFKGLDMKAKLKAITINIFGIRILCKLIKQTNRISRHR